MGSFYGRETITVRMLSTVITDVMVIFTCLKKFNSFFRNCEFPIDICHMHCSCTKNINSHNYRLNLSMKN